MLFVLKLTYLLLNIFTNCRENIYYLILILSSTHYLRLIYNNYFWLPQTPKYLMMVLFTHYLYLNIRNDGSFIVKQKILVPSTYIIIPIVYYSVVLYYCARDAFVVLFGSYRASLFVGILLCAWWVHYSEEIKTKSLGLGLYGRKIHTNSRRRCNIVLVHLPWCSLSV